jgi:hypothetical protein
MPVRQNVHEISSNYPDICPQEMGIISEMKALEIRKNEILSIF